MARRRIKLRIGDAERLVALKIDLEKLTAIAKEYGVMVSSKGEFLSPVVKEAKLPFVENKKVKVELPEVHKGKKTRRRYWIGETTFRVFLEYYPRVKSIYKLADKLGLNRAIVYRIIASDEFKTALQLVEETRWKENASLIDEAMKKTEDKKLKKKRGRPRKKKETQKQEKEKQQGKKDKEVTEEPEPKRMTRAEIQIRGQATDKKYKPLYIREDDIKLAKTVRSLRDRGLVSMQLLFKEAVDVETGQIKDPVMFREFVRLFPLREIITAEEFARKLLDPGAVTGPEFDWFCEQVQTVVMGYVPDERKAECAAALHGILRRLRRYRERAVQQADNRTVSPGEPTDVDNGV